MVAPGDGDPVLAKFHGVIELRETDAGDLEVRVRGSGGRPTKWGRLP